MIEEDVVREEEEELEAGEELGEEDALVNPDPEEAEGEEQYSHALTAIRALIKDCAEGRSDREAEALALAKPWAGLAEIVKQEFAKARAKRSPQRVDYGGIDRRRPPMTIEATVVEPGSTEAWVKETEEAFSSPPTQPPGVAQPKVEAVGPPSVAALVLRRADPPISFFQQSKSPTGIPPSYENAIVALKAMALDCRYDVFHNKVIVQGYEKLHQRRCH
jgi:hypothetical protein